MPTPGLCWRKINLSLSLSLRFNLVVLLSWADYNSKSSKPNGSASPFGRSCYSPSKPTQPARWPALVLAAVLVGNLLSSNDKLVGGVQWALSDNSDIFQAPTDDSGTPATSRAPSRAPTEDSGLFAPTLRAHTSRALTSCAPLRLSRQFWVPLRALPMSCSTVM